MTLETQYGVPAVGVHADAFARLVDAVHRTNGMPGARKAFVPTPVMERSPAELRGYIDGVDPISGRPFLDEIIEALTEPVATRDLRGVDFDRSSPRFVESGSEDEMRVLFRDNGWTDFAPIVLPTEERVNAMLAGTSRDRDEVVGRLRPTPYREAWEFTVEKVAVNAVMAGCEPAHFPVVLALAASGITARGSSTSSPAAMVVVNGPIRHEIGMGGGIGALGPYNRANATIGRSYGLLSQNLQGGSEPGISFMGSQGNPFSYSSVTFAENEEESPWEPYHVQQGCDPRDSAVSIFTVWSKLWTEGLRDTWPGKVQSMLGGQDAFNGSLLVLDPLAARRFVEVGFGRKADLIHWIHENVRIPARRYWDTYSANNSMRQDVELGVEPYATYAKAGPDDLLPVFEKKLITVLVAGGATDATWSAFAGRRLDARFRQNKIEGSTFFVDEWR